MPLESNSDKKKSLIARRGPPAPNPYPKLTYSLLLKYSPDHTFHIGSAPGKFKRNLPEDFEKIFVNRFGFTHVVSILTDNEYKSLDIDKQQYRKLMRQHKMKWFPVTYIVDGSVPVSAAEREKFFKLAEHLCDQFEQSILEGRKFRLLIHCRLGKHRSGMLSACLLLRMTQFLRSTAVKKEMSSQEISGQILKDPVEEKDPLPKSSSASLTTGEVYPLLRNSEESIHFLRQKRGSQCISRQPQEELVKEYDQWRRSKT